jgi:orotate phosphoribosyltransferase
MEPLRFPANKLTTRARVFQIIKDRSFIREKIRLASGKESDFYFDLKPTMFDPEGATLMAELILQALAGLKVDYVGGLAVGAIPLLPPINILSYTKGVPIGGFFVRKEIKDHGTMKRIEGLQRGETLAGKTVVILDDVTTTGGSAMHAVKEAQNSGASVILVLSLVDREEGAGEFYKEQGIPFQAIFKASEFLAGS